MGLINTNPYRAQGSDDYLVDFQFDTNSTSNPTAASIKPNYGTDLAIARTGVGVFTATFAAAKKPARVRGWAAVLGDEPNNFPKVTGYDASTGVVTIKVFVNAAGTISATETTGKTIQVFLTCSKVRASL